MKKTTGQLIMSVVVDWEPNSGKRLMTYSFIGIWDWYDFAQASSYAFHQMAEVEYEVGIIFDMTHSLDIPVGAMAAIQRMINFAPLNMGAIVVAGGDQNTKHTFAMLLRLDHDLKNHITLAPSIDQARAKLLNYYAVW